MGSGRSIFKVAHKAFANGQVCVAAFSDNDAVRFALHYTNGMFFFTGTIEESDSGEVEVWLNRGGTVSTCLTPLGDIVNRTHNYG